VLGCVETDLAQRVGHFGWPIARPPPQRQHVLRKTLAALGEPVSRPFHMLAGRELVLGEIGAGAGAELGPAPPKDDGVGRLGLASLDPESGRASLAGDALHRRLRFPGAVAAVQNLDLARELDPFVAGQDPPLRPGGLVEDPTPPAGRAPGASGRAGPLGAGLDLGSRKPEGLDRRHGVLARTLVSARAAAGQRAVLHHHLHAVGRPAEVPDASLDGATVGDQPQHLDLTQQRGAPPPSGDTRTRPQREIGLQKQRVGERSTGRCGRTLGSTPRQGRAPRGGWSRRNPRCETR